MSNFSIIGQRVPQVSAWDKVTGRAKYADDLQLARPLFIKILRSPHPSAKITSIETSEALSIAGVQCIVTGKNFNKTFGVLPISRNEPAMANERVRYVGEPVAAVAAESLELAKQAIAKIKVHYEILKPVLNFRDAEKETDYPLHADTGNKNNLHKAVDQEFGDLQAGFKSADQITEGFFEFDSVTHAFTEPHATQVEVDAEGFLTVHSATQVPHYLHIALSEVLEIPMHKIRVIKPHLGGGFGGKSDPFPHEMIAAKLALLTKRNVRICFSREEVFFSHHGRHPTEIKMKLGLSGSSGSQGAKITALQSQTKIDGGAYGSFGVVTTYYNGVLLQGPYPLSSFNFHCDRYYTNKPMCGAMRGHGGVNPRFASETLLDEAIVKQGLDPALTRLQMLHQENKLTINEFRITSNGLINGLKRAIEESGWSQKYGKLPYGKGIGVACGFFISGSALPIHWNKMPQSTVRITIDYDGGVVLYSGASDIGQGSDTMLAQMAAEVLGVPMSQVRVISADTRLTPIDLGSYSSRVTFMAGNAARNAAIRMRKILIEAACKIAKVPAPKFETPSAIDNFFRQGKRKPDYTNDYLGANPDYADGFQFKNGTIEFDQHSLKFIDVVRGALEGGEGLGILQTKGVYQSPKLGGSYKGAGAGLSPSYSFTAFITEVDVDPETGHVKVTKVTAAHDCGLQLNPTIVEGQIEGSIHMGLGQALMERMVYQDGAIHNASFLEYKVPLAFEQPIINIVNCMSDESEGPFGAKEVGEGSLAPIIPSIANAIYDAVGVRLRQVPMTPDRILGAIQKC